ncbi:MAG: hypothetical protein ABI416_04470 [Ginsengibacter sp.]
MNRKFYFTAILLFIIGGIPAQQSPGLVNATLNGLQFVFDEQSGSILSISHPATGTMLQSSRDSAGIVDLAFPVREFEPLRLASRFSKNAQITKGNGMVTIHWDELGASRTFTRFKGKVAATVILKEEPDGKSISMSCTIQNQSDLPVPQVIFPDFAGFMAFNGTTGTEFRTGGIAIKPFVDMVVREHDNFYAINESTRWFHYGFVLDGKNLVIKWMDIGGRNGGLSIFSKDWGVNGGYDEGVMLQLSERTKKLRYMHTLYTNIAPNASWQSAEFILTPHENGWAEGIIPYRLWAKQHIKKLYPMPDHIRDGLGFRSIWMKTSFYNEDPDGINFKFSDLPKVAKDSKENGLDELNLWGWYENLWLPLPAPWRYLGTEKDLTAAVAECKKIGVNIAPFITVMKANTETGNKYGLKPNTSNYIYDPGFVPQMNPPYASAGNGSMVSQANKTWQKDVLTSTKHLIDMGISSFSWDQFFSDGPGHHLDTLVAEVRKMAKEKDPQATFSGEAGTNMEYECDYLDYTWNWDYSDRCDYRALISSLQGPRINQNIDRSVPEAKIGFADNLYLNIWTRKPDGINGSDYISNHPELSKALKQCARLRKQFLHYFVNGTFIADCLLSKDCPDAHVSAYTLDKSMLVIVINKKDKKEIAFESNIEPWLKSPMGRYKIKQYDDGTLVKKRDISKSHWSEKTSMMKNMDICIYEVIAE